MIGRILCCVLPILTFVSAGAALSDNQSWPIEFDNGKLTVAKPTKAEIIEFNRKLRELGNGRIPPKSKGEILLDCRVLRSLKMDQYGQPAWVVTPLHVFEGSVHGHSLILKSPNLKDGGVQLSIGKKYRVCACDFEKFESGTSGPLYIWNGAVMELH